MEFEALRSLLPRAVHAWSADQQRVLEMALRDFPPPRDTDAWTHIARTCNCDRKSVVERVRYCREFVNDARRRTHLQQADQPPDAQAEQ